MCLCSYCKEKRKKDINNKKKNQNTIDSFLINKNESKNYYEILSSDNDEDNEDCDNNTHINIINKCIEDSFNKVLNNEQ